MEGVGRDAEGVRERCGSLGGVERGDGVGWSTGECGLVGNGVGLMMVQEYHISLSRRQLNPYVRSIHQVRALLPCSDSANEPSHRASPSPPALSSRPSPPSPSPPPSSPLSPAYPPRSGTRSLRFGNRRRRGTLRRARSSAGRIASRGRWCRSLGLGARTVRGEDG